MTAGTGSPLECRELSVFFYDNQRILLQGFSPVAQEPHVSVLSEEFNWLHGSVADGDLGDAIQSLGARIPIYRGSVEQFDPSKILKAMGFSSFRQQAKNARSIQVVLDPSGPFATLYRTKKVQGEFIAVSQGKEVVSMQSPEQLAAVIRQMMESA